MSSKEELLKRLSDGVVEMEEENVACAAQEYLDAGYPAFDGIMEGLVDGMNRASELFEAEEYFVTDVLLCSDAMYAGLDILRPYLPETSRDDKVTGVIGVVEGDTHGEESGEDYAGDGGIPYDRPWKGCPAGEVCGDGKGRKCGFCVPVYIDDHHHGRDGDGNPSAYRGRAA